MSLNVLHFLLGEGQYFGFLLRNNHVVNSEGDSRSRRVLKARVHELIGEDDRLLDPELAITSVDGLRDRLLVHWLIDVIEIQSSWHDLREQRSANGSFNEPGAGFRIIFFTRCGCLYANLDTCV